MTTLGTLEAQMREAIAADNATAIQSIGARIDQFEQANRAAPVPVLSAALWYAQQGLRVFALQPNSKIPHKRSRGCLDATTDPDQIRAWWKANPDSNVGIATGGPVDVIDVDGPEGVATLAQMLPTLPTVYGRVSSPRAGGQHLYIPAVAGRGNKARIAPGVDYRGAGGYVVAPPSTNVDGVAYVWTQPLELP